MTMYYSIEKYVYKSLNEEMDKRLYGYQVHYHFNINCKFNFHSKKIL